MAVPGRFSKHPEIGLWCTIRAGDHLYLPGKLHLFMLARGLWPRAKRSARTPRVRL